ncbi:hypothetical protein, partial [Deinococcus pimensis]|uniref:hypothetical protein n=1 Tax=Deinococcus pimensis TaxID=309888 RepID=UPI00047FC002
MSTRPKDLALLRTLAIAFAGLSLPLVWPGMLAHLVGDMPGVAVHGHEAPGLSSLLVASDLLTFGAYTVIAGTLATIVSLNRRSLPFDWVVLAFGLFIVACGFTHLM